MSNKQLGKSKETKDFKFCFYDSESKLFIFGKQVEGQSKHIICQATKQDLLNGNFERMIELGLSRV